MNIEVQIEITEDGSYGAILAKRKLSLEATQIPSSFGHIVGDVTNQTIAEAKDKKKVREPKKPIVGSSAFHSLPDEASTTLLDEAEEIPL